RVSPAVNLPTSMSNVIGFGISCVGMIVGTERSFLATSSAETNNASRTSTEKFEWFASTRLRHELPPVLPPVALPARLCEATLAALPAPGPAASHLAKGVIWGMLLTRMIWPLSAAAVLAVVLTPLALLGGDRLSSAPKGEGHSGNVVQKPPAQKPKGNQEEKE